MKLFYLFIFFVCLKFSAAAQQEFRFDDDDLQYAVIKDTDGFVNVRKSPNTSAPIVGKIYKFDVFSVESNKTNWWKALRVDEHDRSYWLEGYIYKDKVSILPDWKPINNKGNLVVIVKKAKFNPKKHKLFYSLADPKQHTTAELLKIDGKSFWGTDGEIPKEVISSVYISIEGNKINIPENAFDDLYEPRFGNLSFCHGPDNTLFISMSNSDGAGGYTVIWTIKGNLYYNRYIDYSED